MGGPASYVHFRMSSAKAFAFFASLREAFGGLCKQTSIRIFAFFSPYG
jgi:hypothetical protein